MKKNLIIGVIASFFALACNNKSQEQSNNSISVDGSIEQSFKDEHTAEKSLDWMGTYEGTLPCADCEGIKTTIVLNEDGTFSSREEYLKSTNVLVESKGSFVWDDSGFRVTLKDDKDYNRTFKVIENAIIHLDTDGNEITGPLSEHYKLMKK